jgi:alkylation response protein AidB-like acyl-CoA dehydrogenase
MDLDLTPEERSFRDSLRLWLSDNVPESWPRNDRSETSVDYWNHLRGWQKKLFDGGWAGVSWPSAYGGRGATPIQNSIFLAEIARANAPQSVGVIGEALVGPTIIAVGSEQQKERFLPTMLSGEHIWCQGFSEPNAGSDVASLSTKAIRNGDHFVVNGQKTWTSFAHVADWCLLLVRTERDAPKHKGITCLLVDMKSAGITVSPLRQMSGDSGFNEVFFSDVSVPVENQLGQLNRGWGVAITVLMNERANLGSAVYVEFRRALEALIENAKTLTRDGKRLADDPVNRQKIGQAIAELEVFRLNNDRALSRLNKGAVPGAEDSILKIFWSEYNQRFVQSAMEILGDVAQLDEFDNGVWSYRYLRSRGNTIEGGTSEIQRNIIAERVLGLPKSY